MTWRNLFKNEIDFTGDFLHELKEKGIEKFPIGPKTYPSLKTIREKFKSEGKIPEPLDTLLLQDIGTGAFSRIETAIQNYLGKCVSEVTPNYNEMVLLNFRPRETKDPLVKKFTEMYIEELNL